MNQIISNFLIAYYCFLLNKNELKLKTRWAIADSLSLLFKQSLEKRSGDSHFSLFTQILFSYVFIKQSTLIYQTQEKSSKIMVLCCSNGYNWLSKYFKFVLLPLWLINWLPLVGSITVYFSYIEDNLSTTLTFDIRSLLSRKKVCCKL